MVILLGKEKKINKKPQKTAVNIGGIDGARTRDLLRDRQTL